MNEYTRGEEVRATLIASVILILCVASAVVLLVSAKGKLIPDPNALAAAKTAEARSAQAASCNQAADKLLSEIEVFKSSVKAARLSVTEEPSKTPIKTKKPLLKKEKEPDVQLAWASAQPSYKQVKSLATCRDLVEATVGPKAEATPGWDAIIKASQVTPPGEDKNQQIEAVKQLHALLAEAPIDKVHVGARETSTQLKAASEKAKEVAEKATVREPLPEGLFARRTAVGLGVILCVIGLLLSYVSVRVASIRRMTTLVPLREVARGGQPGLHAAAILKLAGQHNGGEPGLVIGAAMGGLLAAVLQPADADLFVAGVMGGLLLGLGIQWVLRLAVGASKWRDRATELADIEKPGIPIVLALSSVNVGLEAQFLAFFNELQPPDAAATVEKLASQAEERILAAADAGAAMGAPPGPGGAPPQGYPQQPGMGGPMPGAGG